MQRLRVFLSVLSKIIIILVLSQHIACANTVSVSINQALEKYVHLLEDDYFVGLYIKSANRGHIIHKKHASTYFVPSSVAKILTAAASLKNLKEFHFETTLQAKELPKNGQLNSDLTVQLSGDPALNIENMDNLVKNLKTTYQLKRIKGNIIINGSVFDNNHYGPGWMIEDTGYYYSPPINGITIHKNSFKVFVTEKHQQIHIKYDKSLPVKVTHQLEPHQSHSSIKLSYNDNNEYVLSGFVKEGTENYKLKLAIINTEKFLSQVFEKLLKKHHIEFTGKIIPEKSFSNQKNLQVLGKHTSMPIETFIREMMHDSNNLIADTLFKTLGATKYQSQGTWKNGSQALKSIVEDHFGLLAKTYKMKDGSGLSRYNLITPMQIGDLLYNIYHSDIRHAFIDTLPRAGLEGKQLRSRMIKLSNPSAVRAKTGNMTGISGIAGFVETGTDTLIVVVIFNNFIDSTKNHHQWQDDFILILTNTINP